MDRLDRFFCLIYGRSPCSATATERRTRLRERRRGKISVNLLRLVWEFEGRWAETEREPARGKSKESTGVNIRFFTRVKVVREKDTGVSDLFEKRKLLAVSSRQCEYME